MAQGRGKLFFGITEALKESLTLYVRHFAWLQAVPEKQKEQRFRILESESSGLTELPEIPIGAEMYIDDLSDMGFCAPSGFGLSALSYTDIKAWADLRRIDLQPCEAQLLHSLSTAYANQFNISDKADCEPPYAKMSKEEVRQAELVRKLKEQEARIFG